ncbi:hypothetical protein COV16_01730 [Candidatus Woesearchaeota archaeon CG10_big_fil_rev_8_21_14_0_10_34_8]|nr:MAG: hypothetical protein COV16_01730 [Candidatus Woesearchaeota archaeon CG10_big_fil_rev_8_21_14_0_10_34_8]
MGLEQVKQEIIDNAEAQSKKLIDNAKAEAKKELESAHAVIDHFEEDVNLSLEKELAALERKYDASMKMHAKKEIFQKKKEVLAELFEDAEQNLSKLTTSEKSKLLAKLFQRAKKQCTLGRIYCAKQDVAIVKSFCKNVHVTNMIGGLIMESKDGTIRIDYSFDSLLGMLKERKLQEVAEILFSAK